MVDLYHQYLPLQEEIAQGFANVLQSCAFINGPIVKEFTQNLAHYLQVKYVTPCANGTDALQIALMALGLQPGDEVITPSFTFVATAEVIALLGLTPVFVDIDPQTFTLDVAKTEQAITPKTKCIIPVQLYGQSADMEPLMALAKKHELWVVEDNAQAIGADYHLSNGQSQKVGTIGHIGCTSFYPSKNLGAYGDAGALFTNDDDLGERIRLIANHGQKVKYDAHLIGVNSRLDSFQAVVLNAKLKRLDQYNQARREVADVYDKAFQHHPLLSIPHRAGYGTHVFHQYTLILDQSIDRDQVRTHLQEKGVPTMVYYPIPCHLQKAYDAYRKANEDLTITEQYAKQVISLPMHTELTKQQLNYIIETVLLVLGL